MFNYHQLRKWREQKGISQSNAASRIGITQPYYHELETGKKEPSMSLLDRVATATGIAASDFIEDDPNPTRVRDRLHA